MVFLNMLIIIVIVLAIFLVLICAYLLDKIEWINDQQEAALSEAFHNELSQDNMSAISFKHSPTQSHDVRRDSFLIQHIKDRSLENNKQTVERKIIHLANGTSRHIETIQDTERGLITREEFTTGNNESLAQKRPHSGSNLGSPTKIEEDSKLTKELILVSKVPGRKSLDSPDNPKMTGKFAWANMVDDGHTLKMKK